MQRFVHHLIFSPPSPANTTLPSQFTMSFKVSIRCSNQKLYLQQALPHLNLQKLFALLITHI